jgi:hypothetical protein
MNNRGKKDEQKLRTKVWFKSKGHCWYCGCHLYDKWEIDHFEPKRNYPEKKGDFDNLVPSCIPCNRFKTTFTIEDFRQNLQAQIKRARKKSINFRMSEKYGLLTTNEKPVTFFFEDADIMNNGQVINQTVNPWNERQDETRKNN